MADQVFAAERTRQAIAAAEAGDADDARVLLAEALTLDPEYEVAWLWFAAVTENPGEEKFCLEKARELDPQHRLTPSLDRLRSVESVTPPELARIIDPPPPEFITGYAAQMRVQRRRRLLTRSLIALVLLALLAGIGALVANSRITYSYLALVVADNEVRQLGGAETVQAAQQAVDAWNQTRATSSQQLRLVTFTDNGDPAKAEAIAREIVADGRFVGVIGHSLSTTSLAAAPIYRAAGMPAITPTATADAVTAGNPWYFRTVFANGQQGRGMAIYTNGVLGFDSAIVVSTDDPYGQSLRAGFTAGFTQLGTLRGDFVIPAAPAQQTAALKSTAEKIARIPDPGIIALMSLDPASSALAAELKALGVQATVVAPDALATQEFFAGLLGASPSVVNNSYAATPLTEGTLTGPAVTFYDDFGKQLGYQPSWAAGLTYDAVDAFAEAMMRADVPWRDTASAESRGRVRDALAGARTPETALPVLTGSLYFEADNSAARPVAFDDGRVTRDGTVTLTSAADQLTPYSPMIGLSLSEAIRDGTAINALGETYTVQRVVTAGFNINETDSLDVRAQTFHADFFIWLKYRGDPMGPSDIQFVNAVNPALALGEPLRRSSFDGENYELYRVEGAFHAPMEFSAFPFDSQRLPIVIQNRRLQSSQMTYVPDPDNLEQTQEERLQSGVNATETIDQIPNWQADSLNFYPASVGQSGDLGDPSIASDGRGITFSQMVTTNTISRDVFSFLIKNLLPLFLLTIVVYVSLWYPYKDATARISFGVTGILTGAVMLNSVTSSLPSVDYTVAIEWAYYAFIALSGLCIIGTLVGRRLTEQRQLSRVRILDRVLRIGYPLIVAAVAAAYIWVY